MLRRTLLLSALALAGSAQEPTPPPEEESYEFVSGTVTDLSAGRIVVNRAVLGKPPENRSFLITSETKVEGALKVNARVTVGFKAAEQGEPVAIRIIVRPPQKAKLR